jgi:hypothetical protein
LVCTSLVLSHVLVCHFQLHLSQVSQPCQRIRRRWFGVLLWLSQATSSLQACVDYTHAAQGFCCNRNYSRIEIAARSSDGQTYTHTHGCRPDCRPKSICRLNVACNVVSLLIARYIYSGRVQVPDCMFCCVTQPEENDRRWCDHRDIR